MLIIRLSIDREVDLVSPLVTPLTYEGLVDDVIGIENGRIRLDAAVLGEQEDLSANLGNITNAAGQKMGASQSIFFDKLFVYFLSWQWLRPKRPCASTSPARRCQCL